jgi:hypothetical protein
MCHFTYLLLESAAFDTFFKIIFVSFCFKMELICNHLLKIRHLRCDLSKSMAFHTLLIKHHPSA